MVLIFDNGITVDSVNNLIQQLDSYSDGEITLFFSTTGGEACSMEALIFYLNKYMKDKLTIIFTSKVMSAGVNLMAQYNGEMYLSKDLDIVLIHAVDRVIEGHTRISGFEKNFKKYDTLASKRLLNKLDAQFNLTAKEKEKFLKGKDIIFEPDSFKRLGIPFLKD